MAETEPNLFAQCAELERANEKNVKHTDTQLVYECMQLRNAHRKENFDQVAKEIQKRKACQKGGGDPYECIRKGYYRHHR